MRKFAFVGLLVGLFSLSALAQENNYPKAEVYGGYQYTRFEGGFNANGFDLGATRNFNAFGITADFASGSQNGATNYTYTFGPQIALHANKAWTPFVHALVGGDHASAAGITANGMAVFAGGGVDINFNRYMAFRASGDWMMLHSFGSNGTASSTSSKNFRMPIGVVFKF